MKRLAIFSGLRAARVLGLVLTFAFGASMAFGQNTNDIQKLSLNQPIERQIKGGETHSFQFSVKAGEYARTEVEQKNIDVIVLLFAPDGKLVVEMDGKDGRLWRETVSCVAETGGLYRVEIKAYTAKQSGSYTVKLAQNRQFVPDDRKWLEAEAHLRAGRKFFEQSEGSYKLSIQEFETASELWSELNEQYWEGVCLIHLGWLHTDSSGYETAINIFNKAIERFESQKELSGKGKALKGLGDIYFYLNNLDKAERYFIKSLSIRRDELQNYTEAANSLVSLGDIASSRKNYRYAMMLYEEAATTYFVFGQKKGLGIVLNSMGVLYANRELENKIYKYQSRRSDIIGDLNIRIKDPIPGCFDESKSNRVEYCYNAAIDQFNDIGDEVGIATVSNNIGIYFLDKLTTNLAEYYFTVALQIYSKNGNFKAKGETLYNLSLRYDIRKKGKLAIFFGKQAVNIFQNIRNDFKNLDATLQRSFIKTNEIVYRKLADILVSEGRIPEAQAVLDLLKDEEYEQLTRSGEKAEIVPYSQAEADVIAKIENLVALERERTELQKLLKANGELSAEQNRELEKLNLDIAAANKAFDNALDALGKAEASATTRVDEIKGGKVLQSALTELSEKTNSGIVALYTVLGTEEEKDALGKPIKDKLKSKFGWVIMVTENRYTAYPIDVENLEETVFQFRAALSSDKYNPQPLAEKIYTAIFRQTSPKLKKTLEQDLQEYLKPYKDKTLMWSLDGVLRYIPMAALHDGKQYLVENYQTTVFTKESFVWLMNSYENNWKALGLGVSDKRPNFDALPGVKTELESIVRESDKQTGILNGSIKLNDNFKKQTFFNIINGGTYPVIHISSHYNFDSGKPENSYLLAGDGNLTFAEIKQQQNLFKKVDLLTLSACDTGVSGNGKEAEGFAYLAQSLGAKSVIASLWKVSDTGTPELMTRFYQLRKDNPQMSKGEAFRLAQLSLLDTEAKTKETSANRSKLIELKREKIELPLFVKDKQKPFAHPHYWSSFVLIGNWR